MRETMEYTSCDIIVVTQDNKHILNPKMTKERRGKLELMKKRADIITKNMED